MKDCPKPVLKEPEREVVSPEVRCMLHKGACLHYKLYPVQ